MNDFPGRPPIIVPLLVGTFGLLLCAGIIAILHEAALVDIAKQYWAIGCIFLAFITWKAAKK